MQKHVTLPRLSSQTVKFTTMQVSLQEFQPVFSSSEQGRYLLPAQPAMCSAELTLQVHLRFVRCHVEEIIKSLEICQLSEVVGFLQIPEKAQSSLPRVMLTTCFILVPGKQPFRQKIPEQIISTREKFCLAALGTQLCMHYLTTSIRQRCAE